MKSKVDPTTRKWLTHAGLWLATFASTFGTFYVVFGGGKDAATRALGALSFSASLLAILTAHEFGHYFYARRHGVDTSLPYFLPAPFIGLGTLGAVIRIRSRIPDRNALVDIGAAGPLAGLLVAVPVLVAGLWQSKVVATSAAVASATQLPGPQSLWSLGRGWLEALTHRGSDLATPPVRGVTWVFGDNLLTLFVQRLTLGPLAPGQEVDAHPMVIAAWFGLLVTMLNLMPVGQLDGGHLTHAALGRWAPSLGKLAAATMALLCVFGSAGWLLWLVVTSWLVGFRHPEVSQPEVPLTAARWWVCAACAAALVLCAMPVPLVQVSHP